MKNIKKKKAKKIKADKNKIDTTYSKATINIDYIR